MQEVMDLRFMSGTLQRECTWIRNVCFEEALRQVISSASMCRCCARTKATPHLSSFFNENTLRTMKPTAYLVNTSRGPVVDEVALAEAIGRIGLRARLRCL